MNAPKENLFYVEVTDLIEGLHFEVVTNTTFDATVINHFYELENHKYDYELVELMGLGVVKNLYFDEAYYLYNASLDHLDNSFGRANEVLRISIYYQLTHSTYDDKELEHLIFEMKGGREYLRILQTYDETDKALKR